MTSSVEIRDLRKLYGASAAVDGVSLSVGKGELVALLGPSGCGKTTTLRMIAGFIRPTAGTIRIGDRDVTALPPHRRDAGMVFQSYALFPHLTVAENIAFGLQRRGVARAEIARRVAEIVAILKLDGFERRLPKQLSGGQQQRVAVGRALVINPAVLLLDEPFSNLDAQLREGTRVELRRLQQRLGITTIFVTHDQAEAMSIADRIAVMNAGRIEQIGPPDLVYRQPASRFVATFIGRANLFEVKSADQHTGSSLATSIDGVALEGSLGMSIPGATLVVRPEAIRLVRPDDAPATNAVRGRVDLMSFQGPTTHLDVLTPAGRQLLVELTGATASAFRPGDEVAAVWDKDAIAVCRS